jgi:two-component system, OmpR family, phosphate regulon sensor histidine kinase PhoR
MALNESRQVLFANNHVFSFFGLKPRPARGEQLADLVPHPSLNDAVAATFMEPEPFTAEFEVPEPRRVIAFKGQRLDCDDGRTIVVVLDDMTELRRLENIRQDFFANISHDLKTPLAAIKAFAETLLDGAADDPDVRVKFLKRIEEQTERLYSLVQDMLMLARVESKDPGFVMQHVDAREVVQASVETFRPDSVLKGLHLDVDLGLLPCPVFVDPEGLQVILRNLVDNAVKYTPAGGAIRVTLRSLGREAALTVADEGIGIPPQDLGRVFERFYRVDKARSRQLGGTGLGLSIVKHLVQTFGGTIGVTSQLGKGSAFTVRLPLAAEEVEQPTPTRANKRKNS